jgi:hypothetical protein
MHEVAADVEERIAIAQVGNVVEPEIAGMPGMRFPSARSSRRANR